ncbi:MAG: hypothetical protein V9E89_07575 [Ilumatobacteraceae bacterium]
MSAWDQVMAGVHLPFPPGIEVPTLTEVALAVPNPPPVTDVEATTHAAVVRRLAAVVQPGMTVAVGGGSRGLTDRVPLLPRHDLGAAGTRRRTVRHPGNGQPRGCHRRRAAGNAG